MELIKILLHNKTMSESHANHNHTSFHHRLHSKRHIVKSLKAKMDAERTLTERVADFLTAHFGTMAFLVLNLAWFGIWITINIGIVPGITPFDPFPFGLLTMIVSLEAIFLAVIVLISQNRTAKIDDLREEITLQIDAIAEEEITKIIKLQMMILKKHGVDVSRDPEVQQMIAAKDPEEIEKSLEKQLL